MSASARTVPYNFVGDDDMYGYPDPYAGQVSFDMGPEAPNDFRTMYRWVATGRGNPAIGNQNPPAYIGIEAGHFIYRDRDEVSPETKGVGYALSASVALTTPRGDGDVPWADVACFTMMNRSGAPNKGTDCLYGAHNPYFGTAPEFGTLLSWDTNANRGIAFGGWLHDAAFDTSLAIIPTGDAFRMGNGHGLRSKNAANTATRHVIGMDGSDDINIGGAGVRKIDAEAGFMAQQWFGRAEHKATNQPTRAILDTDNSITFTGAGCTVTLPAGAKYVGRELDLHKTTPGAVVASAAIIIPLTGGPLTATLLGGAAGQWITISMDSAGYWHTIRGGG